MDKRVTLPKDLQALEELKRLMFSRRLIPGQKLIYRDLEDILGMSKTPITQALARLEQEGLVVSKQNRGYFVKELSEDEIVQMYRLRIKLEEISVDFAIDNHSESDLVEWRKYIDAYKNYPNGVYDHIRFQMDIDLHAHMSEMGKNIFLTKIISQFFCSTWAVLQVYYLSTLVEKFAEDHERLFELVASRKREEAKEVIRYHHDAALGMALQGVRIQDFHQT